MGQSFAHSRKHLVRKIKKLPAWVKVAASSAGVLAIFIGVIVFTSAGATPLEEPSRSFSVPEAPLQPAPEEQAAIDAATIDRAATVARSALDAALASESVSLFQAQGIQRELDPAEAPEVTTALEAFSAAGFKAGFVVYDFTTERGLAGNVDLSCFSASTIKAPFATYVMQSIVDSGQASLTDEMVEKVTVEGTGVMLSDDIITYDLGTVLYNTIVYSDNTGYALLREEFSDGFEAWSAQAGVDAAAWEESWYPFYTPRDLGKLWLDVGKYITSGGEHAALCEEWFSQTDTSFIRKALGADYAVLAKPGYEVDANGFETGALCDAGIVRGPAGDYLIAIMSDADYDDEYLTETEPLILNLVAALARTHDSLLLAQ